MKLLDMKYPFSLESHVHHMLALSSILLVKPKRMHQDIIDAFEGNIDKLIVHLEELFGKEERLPWEIVTSIGKTIEDVKNGTITRNKGVVKLLSKEDQVSITTFKIMKSTANLLQKVLKDTLAEEIREQELSTRFVEPFLSGLFDDPDHNVLLRFTGLVTVEGKKNSNLTKDRPDITTTALKELAFGESLGFGEVKCEAEENNRYAISRDLLRIGLFSKMSIDDNNMKGVLAYQIIGRAVVFYINFLCNDGLYVMYELGEVTIPFTIDDLLKFTFDYGKLASILNIYETWCKKNTTITSPARKRPSINDENYNSIIDKVVNRKRHCVTKHHKQ